MTKTTLGAACLMVALAATVHAQARDACGKPMTAEKVAQRALDYAEINNVAGAHEYYHSAFKHQEEIENIWSKRDDIAWQNGSDFYKNRKSVWNFYAAGIKQADPHGALWYHMLTTPMVEVAGDGQTAKAIWMSFGNVTGSGPGGGASMQWTEEKYGMDFIKEDGHWKIWHLRTYVEFYTPYEKGWAVQNMSAPAGASNAMQMGGGPPSGGQGQQGGAPQGQGAPPLGGQSGPSQEKGAGATVKQEPGANFTGDLMKPDEKGDYYVGYYPDRPAPVLDPLPPTPYCTWKDTKGYVIN